MAIESIQAITTPPLSGHAAPARIDNVSSNFSTWLDSQVQQTNAAITHAEAGVRALAAGKPVDIHNVMIDLEAARFSVELMVTVRDRLLESYQEIMRMQV